jgi:hypothetical protein
MQPMLRTPSYPKLVFALTLFCGLVSSEDRWLLGQAVDNGKCSREVNSLLASPAPHSPPILTPPQNPDGLWNQLSRQEQEKGKPLTNANSARVNLRVLPVIGGTPQPYVIQQPNAIQSTSANAVTMPMSDETEKAIAEVRLRLGNAGNRFSDLLSPEDEARLFAEALSQVRQEQQSPANQQIPAPSVPQLPSAVPYQVPLDRPGPASSPPPAAPYPAPHGGHFPSPQLHWAPGQPNPPQPMAWPAPQPNGPAIQMPTSTATMGPPQGAWNRPGNQPAQPLPFPPAVPQPETEEAAMRRIARQVDALAEQLENIKRFSEADSLRRSAQQFRESVR